MPPVAHKSELQSLSLSPAERYKPVKFCNIKRKPTKRNVKGKHLFFALFFSSSFYPHAANVKNISNEGKKVQEFPSADVEQQ